MYVKDFMTENPVVISPEASVSDAFALMKENNVRRLPVVEGESLAGIVAYSDLLKASPSEATSLSIWEINYVLSRLRIRDIMKTDVLTVTPEDPIEKAAVIMRKNKVGALPVVSAGRLVGIITESDIFDAFIDVMGMGKKGTRITILTQDRPGTFAKITKIIADLGLNIISIASFHHDKEHPEEVINVLRVDTESPAEMIEKLKEAGVEILHYEVF